MQLYGMDWSRKYAYTMTKCFSKNVCVKWIIYHYATIRLFRSLYSPAVINSIWPIRSLTISGIKMVWPHDSYAMFYGVLLMIKIKILDLLPWDFCNSHVIPRFCTRFLQILEAVDVIPNSVRPLRMCGPDNIMAPTVSACLSRHSSGILVSCGYMYTS